MKKILLISLLLASFSTAAEANNPIQDIVEITPTKLQDLGLGYERDSKSNLIYYEGKPIEVYSPKTFTIINKENENGYNAGDHYAFYQKGSVKEYQDFLFGLRYIHFFDLDLGIPFQCLDYINEPDKLPMQL